MKKIIFLFLVVLSCSFSSFNGGDQYVVNFGVNVVPADSSFWTEQVSPLTTDLNSVSAVSDNVAWACGDEGKVIRTTNKGVNWVNVSGNLPVAYNFLNMYAWDENLALATASPLAGDYIYRTSNGGTNWSQVFFLEDGWGNGLWMTDAFTAYHVGDPVTQGGNWIMKKSTNGGINWTDWALVASEYGQAGYNNSFMILGNNVWMGTYKNYLIYSSNLGINWSQQTTTFANQFAVWFNNASVGLTAYTSLNKTTNGGINWTALASPVTYYVDGICGRGNEWWVARGSKIYYSSDNGANWTEQYIAIGAFNHINSSRIGSTVWGVRNSGNISRYVSQNSSITPINGTVPDNYSLSQNYPNPFNSMTKVKWQILNANIAKITVFDILGREVRTLVNEKLQPGTYEITFDASGLASGIYFYQLEAGNFVDTKRMILTK